jgi:hypothetical protein
MLLRPMINWRRFATLIFLFRSYITEMKWRVNSNTQILKYDHTKALYVTLILFFFYLFHYPYVCWYIYCYWKLMMFWSLSLKENKLSRDNMKDLSDDIQVIYLRKHYCQPGLVFHLVVAQLVQIRLWKSPPIQSDVFNFKFQ